MTKLAKNTVKKAILVENLFGSHSVPEMNFKKISCVSIPKPLIHKAEGCAA